MSAITASATSTRSDAFLRLVMRVDAIIVGLAGVGLLAATGWFADLSGLPHTVELGVGIFSVSYGAVVLVLAALQRVRPGGIATVVANAICTVLAVGVVVAGVFPLTGLGIALVLGVGLYTLAMAELQWVGVRRI